MDGQVTFDAVSGKEKDRSRVTKDEQTEGERTRDRSDTSLNGGSAYCFVPEIFALGEQAQGPANIHQEHRSDMLRCA